MHQASTTVRQIISDLAERWGGDAWWEEDLNETLRRDRHLARCHALYETRRVTEIGVKHGWRDRCRLRAVHDQIRFAEQRLDNIERSRRNMPLLRRTSVRSSRPLCTRVKSTTKPASTGDPDPDPEPDRPRRALAGGAS